ncbi:MAG: hypothetical protein CMO61_02160 [Verrucomicrobiales bacterium]|jgi:hypothetical protein|nr:hypothetical protein [Verrucomicrobiales bacterium]|tara:strand:+ start:3762 stop:4325 length:564 start_codon:yes stop_codon:yes gene_type:complete
MKLMKLHISLGYLSALAFLFTSCGGGKSEPEAPTVGVSSIFDAVLVNTKPEDAVSVVEARKSASPGDLIAVTGKIAGAMQPFTESFAAAILADQALATCDLTNDDQCPTPWDACCVEIPVIQSMRMLIQVLGDDGRPIPEGLAGVRGMKELDVLVVAGTVAEGSTAENLIVNATEIYQMPPVAAPEA